MSKSISAVTVFPMSRKNAAVIAQIYRSECATSRRLEEPVGQYGGITYRICHICCRFLSPLALTPVFKVSDGCGRKGKLAYCDLLDFPLFICRGAAKSNACSWIVILVSLTLLVFSCSSVLCFGLIIAFLVVEFNKDGYIRR